MRCGFGKDAGVPGTLTIYGWRASARKISKGGHQSWKEADTLENDVLYKIVYKINHLSLKDAPAHVHFMPNYNISTET